jgi:hypothetical protein
LYACPLAPTVCTRQLDPFSRVLLLIGGHCGRKSHQEGEVTLFTEVLVTVCVVGETDVIFIQSGDAPKG